MCPVLGQWFMVVMEEKKMRVGWGQERREKKQTQRHRERDRV
jgi:hypothetical protein